MDLLLVSRLSSKQTGGGEGEEEKRRERAEKSKKGRKFESNKLIARLLLPKKCTYTLRIDQDQDHPFLITTCRAEPIIKSYLITGSVRNVVMKRTLLKLRLLLFLNVNVTYYILQQAYNKIFLNSIANKLGILTSFQKA